MVSIKLDIMLILNIIHVSDCLRRIKDGDAVTTDKRYVVYLVKAPISDKKYDSWVCGGALVSSVFIVTSAACVDDVEYLYAIAGYKKYVTDEEIDTDPCTSEKKKKIIYTCIPLKYELQYEKVERWSYIDIALVKVESPYDFTDLSYYDVCSYTPTTISINFEPRFQEPGTDGLVFGWGHKDVWRQPTDENNYNEVMMRYASIRIMEKAPCKMHYENYPNMSEIIDKYMICTSEKGDLDEQGFVMNVDGTKQEGCGQTEPTEPIAEEAELESGQEEIFLEDDTRRHALRSGKKSNDSMVELGNKTNINMTTGSRKSGICQNDHGGPLVTWVGSREVLIGVASVFRVSPDSKCTGPYLYTSTQCNGAFLDCILSNTIMPENKQRRAFCDSPPILRGYDTVERHISWKNHPAGAAENEALANVKYVGGRDDYRATIENSKAYREFKNIKKFSENFMYAIRPQRPING